MHKELQAAEEEAMRALGEIARPAPRSCPLLAVEKDYVFGGPGRRGQPGRSLGEGRPQLIVQHFMLDPAWDAGCPLCSYQADNVGDLAHLHAPQHHVRGGVQGADQHQIEPFRQRIGSTFPWFRRWETTSTTTST